MKGVTLWFVAIIVVLDPVEGATFFPFGSSYDRTLEREDDSFTAVPLSFDLPFFGSLYRELYVSTNGLVFFDSGSVDYKPAPFPLNDTKCVAAYWVDSDLRQGGSVSYRVVFDPDLLGNITSEVTSKFVNHAEFTSSWAFVVTFHEVPRFGCDGNVLMPCSNVVSHQTILTSNGRESFVIFLYDRLDYSDAQIGFNAGDGKRFFLVQNSNTENISSHALQESNVGEPGKWMFSISGEISSACGAGGLLEVNPRKVVYFGGQEVFITGPCLPKDQTSIDVHFGGTSVRCSIFYGLKIICVAPYLDVQGRVDLKLEYGNITYESFVISQDVSGETVRDRKLEILRENIDSPFNVTWVVSANQNDRPSIGGIQEDLIVDGLGNVMKMERIQIFLKPPNTGSYEFKPRNFMKRTDKQKSSRNTIRKIFLCVERVVVQRIIIETGVDFSCSEWHRAQPSVAEIANLTSLSSLRNPCQPTVPSNFPSRLPGNFEWDDSCHASGKKWCDNFRPGARTCYRSSNNPDRVTTQCCYNDNSELLLGPTGGGSISLIDPSRSKFDFFARELLPNLICCKFQDACNKFREKRPSVDSTNFVPPAVSRATGDPHFLTLDQTEFDFNPVGEFVYLEGPEIMVQTRISRYADKDRSASYFSAFAVNASYSDVVQVELTALKSIAVKLGKVSLPRGEMRLDSLFINYANDSYVSVESNKGVKIEILALTGMLHAIIALDRHLKGKVYGLIGNWDDNPDNDFMLPNKIFIPRNSSNHDIHYEFGMTWATTTSTSIFSYPDGLSWNDFQDPGFVPIFEIPPADPRCNGDRSCMFDLHVTNDLNASLSNVKVKEYVRNIESMLRRTSETCLLNVNVSNGKVDLSYNSSDPRSVNYTITCNPGYKLQGAKTITCLEGKTSSEFPLMCSSQVSIHLSALKRFGHAFVILMVSLLLF